MPQPPSASLLAGARRTMRRWLLRAGIMSLLCLAACAQSTLTVPTPTMTPVTAITFVGQPVQIANANLGPLLVTGPDHNLWLTVYRTGQPPAVARINPSTNATTVFDIPLSPAGCTDAIPPRLGYLQDLIAGPDGNLWFTLTLDVIETPCDKVGRITPAGDVVEYPLPLPTAPLDLVPNVTGLAAGRNGDLWIALPGSNAIGRMTLAGQMTLFPLPEPAAEPYDVYAGPDGAIWFTEVGTARIGRIAPGGQITEFPLPSSDYLPYYLAADAVGNVWFTEGHARFPDSVCRVGRVAASGAITDYALPFCAVGTQVPEEPRGLTLESVHNLWLIATPAPSQDSRLWFDRITVAGTVTAYAAGPDVSSGLTGMTLAPDNHLWAVLSVCPGNGDCQAEIGYIELAGGGL